MNDYIDNLKYQAEILQDETQQAIDKFEGIYNISYINEEVKKMNKAIDLKNKLDVKIQKLLNP